MAARFGLAFTLVMVLTLPAAAQAPVTILNDTFDTYVDQAAFLAAWPAVGAQPSGTLSTTQAVSTPNSVGISGGAATATSERNERLFTGTGIPSTTNTITWSLDFFDNLIAPGNPQRVHSNLQSIQAAGATNELVSLGLMNNQSATASGGNYYMARILGYTPPSDADPDGGPVDTQTANGGVNNSGMFFKLNDFETSPLRSSGWHNLKVVISSDDDLSTDYEFFVDNVLAERVSNFGSAAQRRSYTVTRLGSGLSNNTTDSFWDNVIVETSVPVLPPGGNADFDGDDDVDGADFLTWQRGNGSPGDRPDGNANPSVDSVVDGLDLAIWRAQFGLAAVPAASAIPEPASAALAAVAMLAGLAVVRRR